MLEWLKNVLGDGWTEDVDRKVSEEIGKGFVARADFNAAKAELKTAKEAITERDGQLEELKKTGGDVEAMRTQIATLQKENKQKDEDHAKALMDMRRDAAVEKALTGAGAKNLTAARALLAAFLENAKVGEDGSVPGLDEELKKLSGAEETAFLFAPKDAGPSLAGAKPAGGGGGTPPDPKRTGYEAQLADARKKGDTLAAIKLKEQAAAEGIVLM